MQGIELLLTPGDLICIILIMHMRSQLRRSTMRQLNVIIKYVWEGQNR